MMSIIGAELIATQVDQVRTAEKDEDQCSCDRKSHQAET